MMDLLIYGLNHRTAPLSVRERWAFSGEEARRALADAQGLDSDCENLILSTCNRTEIYSIFTDIGERGITGGGLGGGGLVGRGGGGDARAGASARWEAILDFFRRSKGLSGEGDPGCFYTLTREDAVKHLFRLAAGLDSMIVGEGQILGQIRDAFEVAREAGSVGKVFQRLFPAALRAGKRTRAETGLSRSALTHGQAALEIAGETLGGLRGKRVALLGAGEVSRLAGEALAELGADRIWVVNRTIENARELASEIGGEAAGLEALPALLEAADLIISSTGSARPLVSAEGLLEAARKRGGRPLCVMDLAVPRDFDPACADVPGVSLHNIDQLNRVVERDGEGRRGEVQRAESIIQEELRAFFGQMNWIHLDPVIRHLFERFEALRIAEVEKHLPLIPEEHHGQVQALTSALLKKVLHFPIDKLKSLRDGPGLNPTEIAFLRRLFLDDPPRPAGGHRPVGGAGPEGGAVNGGTGESAPVEGNGGGV